MSVALVGLEADAHLSSLATEAVSRAGLTLANAERPPFVVLGMLSAGARRLPDALVEAAELRWPTLPVVVLAGEELSAPEIAWSGGRLLLISPPHDAAVLAERLRSLRPEPPPPPRRWRHGGLRIHRVGEGPVAQPGADGLHIGGALIDAAFRIGPDAPPCRLVSPDRLPDAWCPAMPSTTPVLPGDVLLVGVADDRLDEAARQGGAAAAVLADELGLAVTIVERLP
jgi:hypothetical protein